MKLRDILRVKGHHVYTVRPDQTVQDAVQILMQHRVGALLVEDAERRAVGIITERDVLRECVDRAAELGHVPVREAMTRDLIIGVPDDEIGYTMGIMMQIRIRHLPVMDGGDVAGMISVGDGGKGTVDVTECEYSDLKDNVVSRE